MTTWTDTDVDYLREQRAAGAPINKIAATLNRNRGAVAGKADRLNIPTPNPPCFHLAKKRHRLPAVPKSQPAPFIPTSERAPNARLVPLLDLDHNQCHFPHGDGDPRFIFCGADTSTLYCEFHNKLAYRKPW